LFKATFYRDTCADWTGPNADIVGKSRPSRTQDAAANQQRVSRPRSSNGDSNVAAELQFRAPLAKISREVGGVAARGSGARLNLLRLECVGLAIVEPSAYGTGSMAERFTGHSVGCWKR